MSYTTTTEAPRYANIAVHSGPSPVGAWLSAAWQRLTQSRAHRPAALRDRVREAAELRTWAVGVRRTDPRFADDLFAAADRHELGAG